MIPQNKNTWLTVISGRGGGSFLRKAREMTAQNKNIWVIITLGAAAILLLIALLSSQGHLKEITSDFNDKKTVLVKENMDLKNELESLGETVKQNAAEITVLQGQRKAIEEKLKVIGRENGKLTQSYNDLKNRYRSLTIKKRDFKRMYLRLRQKVEAIKSDALIRQVEMSISKEQDGETQKLLQMVLYYIRVIRGDKPSEAVPVPAVGKETESPASQSRVLAVDKKNNLVVISLGRKDKVVEGDKCVIFKNGNELARGEVINVRYKISAVFINEMQYKNTIADVAEGDSVLINNK